jgi:hypothetical protein
MVETMIKSIKSIAMVALFTAAFSVGAQAQSKSGTDSLKTAHRQEHHAFRALLNDQQKAMLKENHQKQKTARAAFVASLNNDQKAILKDKSLTHKERKVKLAGTFTQKQKDVMAANKAARKTDRKTFIATLTEDQKSAFKKMAKERHGHHGFRQQKAQKA